MTIDHQAQLRVHIRWMIRRDMPEVLDIERAAFEFPWFEEEFIRCLRQRNCIGMVAEHAERVVGFMIYELHKTRLHILNFAVAADLRRQRLDIPDLVTAKVLEAQRAARPFQVAGHGLSQVAPIEVVEPRSRKMLKGCGKPWLLKALAGSRNVAIDEEG